MNYDIQMARQTFLPFEHHIRVGQKVKGYLLVLIYIPVIPHYGHFVLWSSALYEKGV